MKANSLIAPCKLSMTAFKRGKNPFDGPITVFQIKNLRFRVKEGTLKQGILDPF